MKCHVLKASYCHKKVPLEGGALIILLFQYTFMVKKKFKDIIVMLYANEFPYIISVSEWWYILLLGLFKYSTLYKTYFVLSQNCGFQVFLLFSFSSSLFKCMIIKSIPSVLKPKKYITKTKKNHMEDNYIILLNKF